MSKTPDKRRHNQSERKEAKYLARRQPVSGAFAGMKGDVVHGGLGGVLLDRKESGGVKQFTVSVIELDKMREAARKQGQCLGGILSVTGDGRRYYTFDADDVETLAGE